MSSYFAFLKNKQFYIGILRYGLALIMMGYGLWKMKGYQGSVITPTSSWQLPLEALDGSQLIWAFVGYSRWFQFLLGLFEFVPACLLLFRRTQLLGAVLMLPMTLGVFLVNYALDLWGFTKTSSLLLLLANVLIVLLHWEKVKGIVKLLVTAIAKRKYGWVEVAINIGIIIFMSRKLFTPLYHGERAYTKPFCGDCFNHHPNEWVLIKESVNDSVLPSRNLKCYFTPRGVYSEINDYNRSTDYLMYKVDEKNSRLSIEKYYTDSDGRYLLPDTRKEGIALSHYTYSFTGDTLLKLEGADKHAWLFRRRVINEGRF